MGKVQYFGLRRIGHLMDNKDSENGDWPLALINVQ